MRVTMPVALATLLSACGGPFGLPSARPTFTSHGGGGAKPPTRGAFTCEAVYEAATNLVTYTASSPAAGVTIDGVPMELVGDRWHLATPLLKPEGHTAACATEEATPEVIDLNVFPLLLKPFDPGHVSLRDGLRLELAGQPFDSNHEYLDFRVLDEGGREVSRWGSWQGTEIHLSFDEAETPGHGYRLEATRGTLLHMLTSPSGTKLIYSVGSHAKTTALTLE